MKQNDFLIKDIMGYMEVVPIAPSPKMSAQEFNEGGHLNTANFIWECRRGDEILHEKNKDFAKVRLFEWYCEARVKHDIFSEFTTSTMIVDDFPEIYGGFEEGVWTCHWNEEWLVFDTRNEAIQALRDWRQHALDIQQFDQELIDHPHLALSTRERLENKFQSGHETSYAVLEVLASTGSWLCYRYPNGKKMASDIKRCWNRDAAIEQLAAWYDDDLLTKQIADERGENTEFEDQPKTIKVEIELTLRTEPYRTFWDEIGKMHDSDGRHVGTIGMRTDGQVFVHMDSDAAGEFEYNLRLDQLPYIIEQALVSEPNSLEQKGRAYDDLNRAYNDLLAASKREHEKRTHSKED